MTRITARTEDGACCLESTGHAAGSPAVCAGISALLYALAGWLLNRPEGLAGDSILLEDGHAVFRIRQPTRETAAVFEAVVIGLLQIQLTSPEYIRVSTDMKA